MPAPILFPLLWSDDAGAIADWAVRCLGLTERWRVDGEGGGVGHVELVWPGGMLSINERRGPDDDTGPSGIGLRVAARADVDACHARAVAGGADIVRGLEESRIAYSFTARDPDGNEWWVHFETGLLDEMRAGG